METTLPNITAEDQEEFAQIEEKLQRLPAKILDQISEAREGLGGLECTLDLDKLINHRIKKINIYLPKNISFIHDTDDSLYIYTGPNSYGFELNKEERMKGYELTLQFIDIE